MKIWRALWGLDVPISIALFFPWWTESGSLAHGISNIDIYDMNGNFGYGIGIPPSRGITHEDGLVGAGRSSGA